MDFIKTFLEYETIIVLFVQRVFNCSFFKYEIFFSILGEIFETSNFFGFVLPIFAAINTKLYHKLLISCIFADFTAVILKWTTILSPLNYRPMWWHYENVTSFDSNPFTFYQTDITCVPSEGNPSRHLTVATAFLYILWKEFNDSLVKNGHRKKRFLVLMEYLSIILIVFVLVTLSISRMYFSTSFLHHCIFGIIVGYLVVNYLSEHQTSLSHYTKRKWFNIYFTLIGFLLIFYWVYKFLGDPQWSVKMAFKYCKDPFLLNPSKTLFFACVKCVALLFGIFAVAPLNSHSHNLSLKFAKSFPLTFVLAVFQHLAIYNTPRNYKYLVFYAYTVFVNFIFQTSFLYFIPKFCSFKQRKMKHK